LPIGKFGVIEAVGEALLAPISRLGSQQSSDEFRRGSGFALGAIEFDIKHLGYTAKAQLCEQRV
jgi:hypothetical protein